MVAHAGGQHHASVQTGDVRQPVAVPVKPQGTGSAVNGGEFLMLALATCYCNDLYREAARLGIALQAVEVEAEAAFTGIGLAARDVRYRARVRSDATAERVEQLLRETDAVAEVHNSLRAGVQVERLPW